MFAAAVSPSAQTWLIGAGGGVLSGHRLRHGKQYNSSRQDKQAS